MSCCKLYQSLFLLLAVIASFLPSETLDPTKVYDTCTKPGLFALTFDDGPSVHTLTLLDILRRKQVPATFYIVGDRLEWGQHDDILIQTFEEGHELGAHSWDHSDLTTLPPEKAIAQMVSTDKAIYYSTGKVGNTHRPPYGEYDEYIQSLSGKLSTPIVLWNLDTMDWQHRDEDPDQIFETVKERLDQGDPSIDSWITLQHDLYESSVEQTERIIDYAVGKGYRLVNISECLGYQIEELSTCGDGLCARDETCRSCSFDCGPCRDTEDSQAVCDKSEASSSNSSSSKTDSCVCPDIELREDNSGSLTFVISTVWNVVLCLILVFLIS